MAIIDLKDRNDEKDVSVCRRCLRWCVCRVDSSQLNLSNGNNATMLLVDIRKPRRMPRDDIKCSKICAQGIDKSDVYNAKVF